MGNDNFVEEMQEVKRRHNEGIDTFVADVSKPRRKIGGEIDEEELRRRDELYKDYNQTETQHDKILEEKHPDAKDYRTLRDFFNTLEHYANSSAMFYSFVGKGENTEYWKPELCIRRNTIYPNDGQRYYDFLREMYIKEYDPYLDAGSWIIDTRSEEFFNAIVKLEGVEGIHVSNIDFPAGHERPIWVMHNGYDHFSATIYLDNLKQFEIVKAVIDAFVEPLERRETKKQEVEK